MIKKHQRFRLILWLTFFLLYAATTARDILPADSGEFQLIVAKWGIAHPPGYPLYTIAGALWTRLLPLGNTIFRINLFSAMLAATTLLLIYEAVVIWTRAWGFRTRASRTGGLAAALMLGSAATFWAQATIANIRMPTILFTAWGFLALAQYQAPHAENLGKSENALLSLALALGLGVGHHPSLIFVAIGWALYLLLTDPQLITHPRRWWKAVPVAALAWGIPQLYLPLRSTMLNEPLSPGNLATWKSFWDHVLARGFGGDMFAFATATDLALRLPLLPTLFQLQFAPLFLLGIGISWLWVLRYRTKLGLAMGVSWIIHTFVSITYRAPQTVEYLMPAYVPMALIFGLGMATLVHELHKHRHTRRLQLVTSCVIVILLIRIPFYIPDFAAIAGDTSIRARVEPLLTRAPEEALILADWRWATPLWVLQHVEGLRPDAEVTYVNPECDNYEDDWRAYAEATEDRPIISTHSYDWSEWTFAPVGGGFRLYRRPLTTLPAELTFTPIQGALGIIKILGYQWTDPRIIQAADPRTNQILKPGQQIELQLAWQASGPQDPPPSFTVRLWDSTGELLAQSDRWLGSDTAVDEVRFTRLTLQLPVDRCTNVVYATVGAYTIEDNTFHDLGSVSLPEQVMQCAFPRLPIVRLWPGFVGHGGPGLRGVDYDVNGEQIIAHLHWCGPGKELIVNAGEKYAIVSPLGIGECQTIRLPIPSAQKPQFTFLRPDGTSETLISLPLPHPKTEERYIPFGNEIVLTSSQITQHNAQWVLNLQWHTVRPIVNDYAISTRLLDENGSWMGMHDMQPGLGALPTLKWSVRDSVVLDTHPFTLKDTGSQNAMPQNVAITVYERFRMTPLLSTYGEPSVISLDK